MRTFDRDLVLSGSRMGVEVDLNRDLAGTAIGLH
jgi:hypothetical protein